MTIENQISNWIQKYLIDNKLKTLVVGVSGGIDSAVVSTLCAMTGSKTKLLIMPIHQNTDETNRGLNHCKFLKNKFSNVEMISTDLTDIYELFSKKAKEIDKNKLSLANTRARIRMTMLYLIAGSTNGIVVGTGNKVEDFGVGFFTKYGDGGVDISPIADLMKSEVYDLAKKLGVSNEIINALPTDGLWDDGRVDEDQLGVTYDELEWAMNYDSENLNQKSSRILEVYNKHRQHNLHKMKKIPIFKKDKE